MCSGITCGRVFNGELLCTNISEVNLSAFTYRLFHEDFSSVVGTNTHVNADKLTSEIFVSSRCIYMFMVQLYSPENYGYVLDEYKDMRQGNIQDPEE